MQLIQTHLRHVLDQASTELVLLIVGILVFAGLALAGQTINRLIRRTWRGRDETFGHLLATLVGVGMVGLGAVLGLWIALPSLNFEEAVASLGITGLILGFALKELVENFVAGIILLWRRPFRIGEEIRFRGYAGPVEEINVWVTVLRTYDGVKVFLPNAKVLTEVVENLSPTPAHRTTVVLGIDPAASVAEARQIILETLRPIAGVLPEPPVLVLLEAIGAYTLNLQVLYWSDAPTRIAERAVQSEVTERLNLALTAAGIRFPYPTQTVHLTEHQLTIEKDGI